MVFASWLFTFLKNTTTILYMLMLYLNSLIIIAFILLSFACANETNKGFNRHQDRSKERPNPSYNNDNFWNDKQNWGSDFNLVDYRNNDISFFPTDKRNTIVQNDSEIQKLYIRENGGEHISQGIWDKAINSAIDGYFKNNANEMKVVFFRSAPGYMDVAVFKTLADKIRML